jgi:hypothetical protein
MHFVIPTVVDIYVVTQAYTHFFLRNVVQTMRILSPGYARVFLGYNI